MRATGRGRPQASSREAIADAAIELFFEQGYEATTVVDITRRAGVSRATFFNYFESKSATLWFVLDQRVTALETSLAAVPQESLDMATALRGDGERPDTLALAIVDGRTMHAEAELERGRAERQLRVAVCITAAFERAGRPRLEAAIYGGAYAAAYFEAVWAWAARGAGRHSLDDELVAALNAASELLGRG